MAYGTPADPVGGTVITVAYAVANLLNPIRWLRLMTGNADPPGSSYVVVSDSTTGTTWRKIPADALAAGVAISNLGYTPVSRTSDLALVGPHGWGASTYLTATDPNLLFLVSGQNIYLVDAANPGSPTVVIDVVNKTFTMTGGSISVGALTLSAALAAASATISGALGASSASISGALSAASAAISGQLRVTKTGPTPSATSYDTSHAVMITTDTTAPTLGFERSGISGITLYESGNRLFGWGADNAHGEVALATGSLVASLYAARAVLADSVGALSVTDAGIATANKDGVAGTPSMRTIGTGATQAAAGNHAHASPAFAGGTYSGNGAGTQSVALAFVPKFVFIQRTDSVFSQWMFAASGSTIPQLNPGASNGSVTSPTISGASFVVTSGSGTNASGTNNYSYAAWG